MVGFAGVPVGRVERLAAPYRGLYPVATLVDVARAVSMGIEVEFPGSAGSGLWVDNCAVGDPSNEPKQGGGGSTRAQFPGVAVWAAVECAAVGAVTDELRDSASSALRAVEEQRAEEFLNSVLEGEETVEQAGSIFAAARRVRSEGWEPVVLMSPEAAVAALEAKTVHWVQGGLVTVTGARVVVSDAFTSVWVVGDIYVWRSPAEVYESFDVETNARLVVAERTLAVGWAGPAVRVEEGS